MSPGSGLAFRRATISRTISRQCSVATSLFGIASSFRKHSIKRGIESRGNGKSIMSTGRWLPDKPICKNAEGLQTLGRQRGQAEREVGDVALALGYVPADVA